MFCCSSRDDDKKNQQQRSIDVNNREQNQNQQQNQHTNNSRAVPLQAAQPSGKPVGVGIVFQPDSTGALHVKSLAVNGPAEKSQQVLPPLHPPLAPV